MADTENDMDCVRRLVRTLRSRIVAWEYPPQFQLVEENLVQEFGISRSPIRQAMTHLAAEGLLDRLPRRGFRVRQLHLRDVKELYEYRLALELQVVQALADKGMSEKDLVPLEAMWHDPSSLAAKSIAELAMLDEEFHGGLAQAHGNRLIMKHLAAINERLLAFREIDFQQRARLDTTCDEHNSIVHAIVARDAALAGKFLRRNINSALSNVEQVVVQLVARSYLNPALTGDTP